MANEEIKKYINKEDDDLKKNFFLVLFLLIM